MISFDRARKSGFIQCFALAAIISAVGCVESAEAELEAAEEGPLAGEDATGVSDDCTEPPAPADAPLVREGRCGKLVYRKYANRGQARAINQLPDFSYAGYERGGVPIPDVRVVKTVSPVSGDAREMLQKALDDIKKNVPVGSDGFRGALLIKRGRYELKGPLVIPADGIVLRGEGQGPRGTILVDTAKERDQKFIQANGPTDAVKAVRDTRTRISTRVVPVGATSFEVESADAFKPGDTIVVLRTPNQKWITDLDMEKFGWEYGDYAVKHERQVVAVDGRRVTIDIPIVDSMDQQYGGGSIYKVNVSRMRNVGIENMRIESTYAAEEDENHAWTAVFLGRVTNSWVRKVTARHFAYSTVTVNGATFSTVEDAAYIDPKSMIEGGRRYAFVVNGGMGVLFQRLYARTARHAFVTGAGVTGPHVWLDALAEDSRNDDGPHQRWSTGLLFDNVKTRDLHASNHGDAGSGHGWAAAQTLMFNSEATRELVCDAPLGAMNYAIGCKGALRDGHAVPEEPEGIVQSLGHRVEPRSLYFAQLRDRLGHSAVEAVSLPKQRSGTIWRELAEWKGDGPLAPKLQ